MEIMNSFVIFGRSGSGKTTLVNELIKKINAKKVYAIDFKEQIFSENVQRLVSVEELVSIAKKQKNCIFIIDDATGILRKGNYNYLQELQYLLSTRRHDNNYYVFVYHSIYYFNNMLEALIDFFIFFDISEKSSDIEKYFSSFTEEECKAASMKKGLYKYVIIKK
jgi:uridine kinase